MKKTHIVLLVFIAALLGVVIYSIGNFATYQTFTTAKAAEGQEIHVVGELVKGAEIHYDPLKDPNYFSFFMKDKGGKQSKVVFVGSKPQDFERSEQVVLTGKMVGDEFHASNILLKCPSKYVNDKLEVQEYKAVRPS